MYLACTVAFNRANKALKCNGDLIETSNPFHDKDSLFYATCSSQFTIKNDKLTCQNTFKSKNDLNFNDEHYFFELDGYTLSSSFIFDPVHLKSVKVKTVEKASTTFDAQDYSNLITIALPSLIIAFSFNFIYRQITNKR